MADETEKPSKEPATPAASFTEVVTQWERDFNAYANRVMGTEQFSQAMNEAQKSQLAFQRMVSDWTTGNLKSMNMPTRDDVLKLGEAIQALDRRLERIEEKLSIETGAAQSAPAKKRPPRTRKPSKSKKGDDK